MSALPIIRWIVHPLIGNVSWVSFTLLLTNLILGTAGSDIWFMDLTDRSMVRIRILPSQGNNNVASRCREASLSRGNTRAYALVNGLANGENPYWLPKPDHSGSMSGRKITCLRLVLAVSLYYYPLIG
uniref:Secreted protein n=1 Tax=Heterorhabditis bacteriophora TaxID=37862 RepID=A0A1I7WDP1_HETBA